MFNSKEINQMLKDIKNIKKASEMLMVVSQELYNKLKNNIAVKTTPNTIHDIIGIKLQISKTFPYTSAPDEDGNTKIIHGMILEDGKITKLLEG